MEVQIILRKLGIGSTYKGYHAVVIAVTLALEDENRLSSVTKEIYEETAKRLNTTTYAVEKNIRTVAHLAWEKNRSTMEMIAGFPLNAPPAVSDFLDYLTTYIKRNKLRLSNKKADRCNNSNGLNN